LSAMRRMGGWDGSNVTMPNKQAVIPHLDGLSDAAALIGAVNVIEKTEEGKLIGHNTDGAGFMKNIAKSMASYLKNRLSPLLDPEVQDRRSWCRRRSTG
ncbi:MAG: hypothetical protein ACLUY3_01915, partial [Eggerthellaceae bacterium]